MIILAIALEKTDGWDGASGKRVRELLAQQQEAEKELDTLRLLLGGDTRALASLIDVKRLPTKSLFNGKRLFHDHGYPLAEQCFQTLAPDMPGLRVHAWMSIPKDKRAPVDALMEKLLDGPNKAMLAEAALSFYVGTKENSEPDSREFLDFALRLGAEEKVFSILTVMALIGRKKPDEALCMLDKAMARAPLDSDLPTPAGQRVLVARYRAQALLVYRRMMAVMAEPQVRNVRLAYLDSSTGWAPGETDAGRRRRPVGAASDRRRTGAAADRHNGFHPGRR